MDEDKAVALVLENWNALGVQAHGDILHLPAAIKRRDVKGALTEVRVMLRNVSNDQLIKARVQSRQLALGMKLDLDRDKDLVEQLENYAILAFAIRDARAPFDQHVPDAEELLRRYDNQSLSELWARYNVWVDMLDPRFGAMDHEQLWRVIVRIAAEGSPSPLVAMPSIEQITCITLMAREALHSPNRPSWAPPPATLRAAS
jgi:hypothetical protein